MRIASLCPATTEILINLGATDLLVGRTADCIGSRVLQQLPVIAEAKKTDPPGRLVPEAVDQNLLDDLNPDLILTSTDPGSPAIDARSLSALNHEPTFIDLSFRQFDDLFENTLKLGELVDRSNQARAVVTHWKAQFDLLQQHVNAYLTGPTIAILLSTQPLVTAGLWLPELVERAGGTYPYNKPGTSHALITPAQLNAAEPEFLIFASRMDPADECAGFLPSAQQIKLDDPTIITTPGPRLIAGFEFLIRLLHGLS